MLRKRTKKIITLIIILLTLGVLLYSSKQINILSPDRDILSTGSIISSIPTEYRVPVGGTLTISYTINTWNGRQWYWPDLDTYQYNYKVVNRDTGYIVKYGAPWRLIHAAEDSISLTMPNEGIYNYAFVETIDFLQEGRTVTGAVRNFKVIVGSGVSPTPMPPPILTNNATPVPTSIITIVEEPEPTPPPLRFSDVPEPKTTFNPYVPPSLPPQPTYAPIIIETSTPKTTSIPVPVENYTPLPTPTSMSSPLPTPTTPVPIQTQVISKSVIKETPQVPGFEIILIIIVLFCFGIRKTFCK